MNCTECSKRLGRWYDGELGGEHAAWDRHIRICRRCSANAETLHRIDRMLDDGIPDAGISPAVVASIHRRAAVTWWSWAAAAATISIILGVSASTVLYRAGHRSVDDAVLVDDVLKTSFGPGSLRGIDDLAPDSFHLKEDDR